MTGFESYSGDLIGLPTSIDHLVFRWKNSRCKVLFSICKQGNAISSHFASDKKGVRNIVQVINEFCEFVFNKYYWCEMIIAKIKPEKRGVMAIARRCGFKEIAEINNILVYARKRP